MEEREDGCRPRVPLLGWLKLTEEARGEATAWQEEHDARAAAEVRRPRRLLGI